MGYTFEEFVLDPERRELSRRGKGIPVGPQIFDLLQFLLVNRDRVVSKQDLLAAVWRGRVVSESTLTSHINAARKAVADDGEQQRIIRTVARRGFRFVAEVRESQVVGADLKAGPVTGLAEAATTDWPDLPDKPSLAVLPFLNLSGDAEQDYFIDGVVEDVISSLARNQWLFVIARDSSFTYRSHPVDVKQVGQELGVRYVLEGSLRKVGNRVRITGMLIDATTRGHIWADRFESVLEDIFELQDQIASAVAAAIAPQVERAEIRRVAIKTPENLGAYDHYLRGMARFHQGGRQATEEALSHFYRALEQDPDYAPACAMAAWCYAWRKVNGWTVDRHREFPEGARLARHAAASGPEDAVALARSGHALPHLAGDVTGGSELIQRSQRLNPNLATAWYAGGFSQLWHGKPEEAIEQFARAMRLSPFDPEICRIQGGVALAHMLAGRVDAAAEWAEKAVRALPDFALGLSVLAASYALAGRGEEAAKAADALRRVVPTLRVSELQNWTPIRDPQHMAPFSKGLRLAGIPE